MKAHRLVAPVALAAVFTQPALTRQAGAPPPPETATLFQNVRIFDGKGAKLSAPSFVLVRGKRIEKVSARSRRIAVPTPS